MYSIATSANKYDPHLFQPWKWPMHMSMGPHPYRLCRPHSRENTINSHQCPFKWIEAQPMSTTTAVATIEQLRCMFAQHGIPETLVLDNGLQFMSDEFVQFCLKNGIHHVLVTPYHPSSNGLAERAVQTIKNGIRKMEEGNLQLKLSRVLLNYRITPQSTTGKSPAELLMNRQLRSCLNLLQPSLTQRVEKKQAYQKSNHDKQAQERSFEEGEEVYVKNYGQYGQRWLKVMLSL